ncbi:MAG: hypothetical protein SF053_18030 [Bacteroidia bacterium]|nr:hypothetical protein [Bacteroidia bacterium]
MHLNITLRHTWIVFLAAGLLLACSTPNSISESFFLPEADDSIRSSSYGVTYYFSDSARVTARMVAGRVREKSAGGSTSDISYLMDQGVEIYFLDRRGQAHSTLKAEEGFMGRGRSTAEIRGNVRMVNETGETLETELLYWDQRKDSIYTPAPVRIKTRTKTIYADRGLRSNAAFTAYFLFGIRGDLETNGAF